MNVRYKIQKAKHIYLNPLKRTCKSCSRALSCCCFFFLRKAMILEMSPASVIKPRSGVVLRIFSRKRKKGLHGFSCLSRLCLPLNDIYILNIFVSGSRVAQIPTVANNRAAKSQNKMRRYLTNFMSINRSNPLF